MSELPQHLLKTDVFFPTTKDMKIYLPAIRELEVKLLSTDTSELHLTLIGTEVLSPDLALAIWDLLQQRPQGMKLVTKAMSGLMESNILPWLAGDVRILRNDGWIFFTPSVMSRKAGERKAKIGSSNYHSASATPFEIDDARVIELISHYIPLKLASRQLWYSELAEWIDVVPTPRAALPEVPKDYQFIDFPIEDSIIESPEEEDDHFF